MGTDIRIIIESPTDSGGWRRLTSAEAAIPEWPFPKDADGKTLWPDDDLMGRNYEVFAFLAGVRNGFGFAGVYRHEVVSPAFEGRGWPEDATVDRDYDGDEEDDSIDIGDHSFTWCTMAELRALDWDTEFHSGGVVSLEQYREWRDAGAKGPPPGGWSGGVSGPGIVTVDRFAADCFLDGRAKVEHGTRVFVRIDWTWRPLKSSGFYRWVERSKLSDGCRLLLSFDS